MDSIINTTIDTLRATSGQAANETNIHLLRKVASSMGIKGASRNTKPELVERFLAYFQAEAEIAQRLQAAEASEPAVQAEPEAQPEAPVAEASAPASEPAAEPKKARRSRKAMAVGTFVAPTSEVPKAERADKALEYLRANPGATAHQVAEALCLSANYAPQMATAALTQLIRRGAATKTTNDKGATVYSAL
jgi:hypothetical protein